MKQLGAKGVSVLNWDKEEIEYEFESLEQLKNANGLQKCSQL